MTKVRLCFHDRCFDGTASAALFYRFYRERFDRDAEFGFTGMTHKAKQPWEGGIFDGDEMNLLSGCPATYSITIYGA